MRLSSSLAALGAIAIVCSCASPTQKTNATLDQLKKAAAEGKYMYAHQDDLSYGHSWPHVQDIAGDQIDKSDVKSVCGDFPAIVGFDLGGIELQDSTNLDGVSFEFMHKAAEKHIERGGIVTLSWHPRNPLTMVPGQQFPDGTAWDVSSDKVVASIVNGGENEAKFDLWLDRVADFIATIKNPDGTPAQIIFRPWHEHNFSWFWWGQKLCSTEDYLTLWHKTYDSLVKKHGLTELVWAYSPNGVFDEAGYLERYPGDDIIDIIGFDYYHFNDNFVADMRASLEVMTKIAQERGKVIAVTETGLEGIPEANWWTERVQPSLEGFPVSYVLTWRNACDRATHFYGPFPGADCEADFVNFAASEKTLFLNDITK